MNTQALLSQFLAPSFSHRDDIKHIIRRDGRLYATNGSILVSLPDQLDVEAIESPTPKNIQEIIDNARCEIFLSTFPELPDPIPCKPCHGTGETYECRACNGEGHFADEPGQPSCGSCDGTGQRFDVAHGEKIDCWFCDGLGNDQQPTSIEGKLFDRRYLALIKQLPGVRFSVGDRPLEDKFYISAGYFTFDGNGEGVLMPMRK